MLVVESLTQVVVTTDSARINSNIDHCWRMPEPKFKKTRYSSRHSQKKHGGHREARRIFPQKVLYFPNNRTTSLLKTPRSLITIILLFRASARSPRLETQRVGTI